MNSIGMTKVEGIPDLNQETEIIRRGSPRTSAPKRFMAALCGFIDLGVPEIPQPNPKILVFC